MFAQNSIGIDIYAKKNAFRSIERGAFFYFTKNHRANFCDFLVYINL